MRAGSGLPGWDLWAPGQRLDPLESVDLPSQEALVNGVGRQSERSPVSVGSLKWPVETAQECAASGMPQVVTVHVSAKAESVDEPEPPLRTARHRNGHRSVQMNYGGRVDRS